MNRILFITCPSDVHAKSVISHFKKKVTVDFLDLSLLGSSSTIALDDMGDIIVRQQNCVIDFNSYNRIWFRRIFEPKFMLKDPNSMKRYRKREFTAVADALAHSKHTNKIFPSHNAATFAEDKYLQLMIAKQVGLNIPKTVVGNSASDIQRRFKSDKDIIVKPFYSSYVRLHTPTEDKTLSFGTRASTIDEAVKYSNSVRQAPFIAQERIPKKHELRITIVGGRIFSAAIDTTGRVDGRMTHQSAKHWSVTIPKKIQRKLLLYMDVLGINFACIDMIVTPNNDYIFIEANPNGQWLWIEERINLPISKAIAKILTSDS